MTTRRALRAGAIAALCVAALLGGSPAANSAPHNAIVPTPSAPIIFQSERIAGDHTQTDIDSIDATGATLVPVTRTEGTNEFGPSWSPNGKRIAFWRTKAPFGTGSLWVLNASTFAEQRLTKGVDARDPDWSPDGRRLVYDASTDLYSLRVSNGLGRTRLTHGKARDFEPAWSPDGTSIAFTRGFDQGDVGDIYLLDVESGEVTQVTDSPGYDHQVGWSPNGKRLVFERDFAQRSFVVTASPGGSDETQLTHGQFFDIGPAYSANGASIIFGSDRGSATGDFDDLWIMKSSGIGMHRFVELDGAQGFADWRPAGTAAR